MKFMYRKIFYTALLLLICFVAAEMIVRVFLKFNRVYDEEMSRYSMEVKKDSPDPLIGHVHRPYAETTLMGAKVRINSDGLRDKEYPIVRGNEKRIVFLGDSLTFGWGVEEEDSFGNMMEKMLNELSPTEIINFGTGNYNTEQEVHLFLQKGLKYNPDKVVVFYFINDAEITPGKSKLWFLGYSQLVTLYWSRMHILLERFRPSQGYKAYYSSLYQKNQPGFLRAQKAFLLLRDVCRKNNIALQVVLLPELHEVERYPFQREHQLISDFLKLNQIESLDLAPYFSKEHRPMDLWVARDDAHPNKKGHQLIAQYAFDFISDAPEGKIDDQSIS